MAVHSPERFLGLWLSKPKEESRDTVSASSFGTHWGVPLQSDTFGINDTHSAKPGAGEAAAKLPVPIRPAGAAC